MPSIHNPLAAYSGYMHATRPAPAVPLVVSFLNTLDVEDGTDVLSDLASYRRWVAEHGDLRAGGGDQRELHAARELRGSLRAVLVGDAHAGGTSPPLRMVLTHDGDAELRGDGVPGTVAAAVATLAIRGEWRRIKICPADDCRWAFYDASRNRSRQWCSMAVCGNRAKARAHRERAR